MDFETTSNQSDDLKSSISSFSSSLYQNEFADLRHPTLIHDHCSTSTHNDSGCDLQYEDHITDLSGQLQNVLKLNEQYKNDLFDLESKYHDKIEILLRHNNQMKSDLRNANEQVERLLGNFVNRTNQFVLPETSLFDLERKCHELTLQNSCLQTQLLEIVKEKEEFESLNKQMKIELNECKSQVTNKTVCVAELKDKVSEQFIKLQSSSRNENVLNELLGQARSEVENLKKAKEWYKQQLSQAQTDKRKLTEDLLQCKLNLSTSKETLEILQTEVTTWKNKFYTFQLYTQKEKETLSSQEIKTVTLATNGNIPEVTYDDTESLINSYRCEISDLQKTIFHINKIIEEQNKSLKKLTSENSSLTSHCVMLQKTIQQKEYLLEKLELDKSKLLTEIGVITDGNKEKCNQVLILKNKLDKFETELSTKNTEKDVIESSIKTIRGQFFALKLQYNKQKHEIMEKNKQILHLQSEKQELFMNNNWKVCELEKAKEKDTQIERLKNELVQKDLKINKYSQLIKELRAEISKNEEVNENHSNDKEILVDEHSKEMERYESVLLQYRKTVDEYKNQIHQLQDIVQTKTLSLTELEHTIDSLKTEMKIKDLRLTELCDRNLNEKVENVKVAHHMEIDADEGEKHFLQRLCNDLRLALKSYIKYNNVLKEQLNRLSREKGKFNSIPVLLPNIPEKYSEQYVNELLQQNKMLSQDNPLSDIQSSLDNLKREIFTLQEQVLKKE